MFYDGLIFIFVGFNGYCVIIFDEEKFVVCIVLMNDVFFFIVCMRFENICNFGVFLGLKGG